MGRLRLITFDLDNTLWSTLEVIVAAEKECCSYLTDKYPEHAPALSCEAIRAARTKLLNKDSGRRNDLSALRRDAMRGVLLACGLSQIEANEQSERAFEVFHDARNRVTLFDGAVNTLRTLAERYIIGALTNGNADLSKIGIADLFAFHHSSETTGRRKPDPRMFHAALESAGVEAAQSLHVGDHPLEDVHAAREVGFEAAWANFNGAKWPPNLRPPRYSISSLSALVDLAGRLD